MVIHNLQTEFRLLVTIVHTRDSKNIVITSFSQVPHLHREIFTRVYISFQIEWDMIVMTVFLSILNQGEFNLVQNRKKNCHDNHIPFNLKGNASVCT